MCTSRQTNDHTPVCTKSSTGQRLASNCGAIDLNPKVSNAHTLKRASQALQAVWACFDRGIRPRENARTDSPSDVLGTHLGGGTAKSPSCSGFHLLNGSDDEDRPPPSFVTLIFLETFSDTDLALEGRMYGLGNGETSASGLDDSRWSKSLSYLAAMPLKPADDGRPFAAPRLVGLPSL
jgi:hypothetical protein